MGLYTVSLDVASVLALPRLCPSCGDSPLAAAPSERGVVFSCSSCRRAWAPALGALLSVDPAPDSP